MPRASRRKRCTLPTKGQQWLAARQLGAKPWLQDISSQISGVCAVLSATESHTIMIDSDQNFGSDSTTFEAVEWLGSWAAAAQQCSVYLVHDHGCLAKWLCCTIVYCTSQEVDYRMVTCMSHLSCLV